MENFRPIFSFVEKASIVLKQIGTFLSGGVWVKVGEVGVKLEFCNLAVVLSIFSFIAFSKF